MSMMSGYRTYLAAAGLLGLALYQLSVGQYEMAWQSLMAGLAAFGLRSAITHELGGSWEIVAPLPPEAQAGGDRTGEYPATPSRN